MFEYQNAKPAYTTLLNLSCNPDLVKTVKSYAFSTSNKYLDFVAPCKEHI